MKLRGIFVGDWTDDEKFEFLMRVLEIEQNTNDSITKGSKNGCVDNLNDGSLATIRSLER